MLGVPSVGVLLIDGQIKIDERYVLKSVPRTGQDAKGLDSLAIPSVFKDKHRIVTTVTQPKQAIWMGPVAEAQFTHEVEGGIDTLKDRHGKILWTNAAEVTNADLSLQSTESGETQLLGKKGKLLWQGSLPDEMKQPVIPPAVPKRRRDQTAPSPQAILPAQSLHSSLLVDTYHRVCYGYGIHINGVNGQFTITDNTKRVLWSGTLPNRPTIQLRRGHNFWFFREHSSVSGIDRVTKIRFAVESGEVDIHDNTRNSSGTLPVTLMKMFQSTVLPASERQPEPQSVDSGLV